MCIRYGLLWGPHIIQVSPLSKGKSVHKCFRNYKNWWYFWLKRVCLVTRWWKNVPGHTTHICQYFSLVKTESLGSIRLSESIVMATPRQGGWVGVGYPYPDVSKITPLLTLPQTPPNRYNFDVSKATLLPKSRIFLFLHLFRKILPLAPLLKGCLVHAFSSS